MRIETIKIIHMAMPMVVPWTTAYGSDAVSESVLLRLGSGEMFGWGESTPLARPTYPPESARTLFPVVRDFIAPLFRGQAIASGRQLQERLVASKGNPSAKASSDLAW